MGREEGQEEHCELRGGSVQGRGPGEVGFQGHEGLGLGLGVGPRKLRGEALC